MRGKKRCVGVVEVEDMVAVLEELRFVVGLEFRIGIEVAVQDGFACVI
jgi:hypothetical protein